MEPTNLAGWKQIGPRLIDVGHNTVVEVNYTGDTSLYKAFFLDHVVMPIFAASGALYEACRTILEQLERKESIRASQKSILRVLRAALGLVPPVDEAMLQYALSQLDKGKK